MRALARGAKPQGRARAWVVQQINRGATAIELWCVAERRQVATWGKAWPPFEADVVCVELQSMLADELRADAGAHLELRATCEGQVLARLTLVAPQPDTPEDLAAQFTAKALQLATQTIAATARDRAYSTEVLRDENERLRQENATLRASMLDMPKAMIATRQALEDLYDRQAERNVAQLRAVDELTRRAEGRAQLMSIIAPIVGKISAYMTGDSKREATTREMRLLLALRPLLEKEGADAAIDGLLGDQADELRSVLADMVAAVKAEPEETSPEQRKDH